MQAITLSESAVAMLRFRLRGYRMPIRQDRRAAFEELVAAGVMEPAWADYRLVDAGRAAEILREQEDRIERGRYEPPDADLVLSGAARGLLRRIASGERVEVTDANRPAFRELADARVVVLGHTFAGGPESAYRFTYFGWERRFELTSPSPAGSISPRP